MKKKYEMNITMKSFACQTLYTGVSSVNQFNAPKTHSIVFEMDESEIESYIREVGSRINNSASSIFIKDIHGIIHLFVCDDISSIHVKEYKQYEYPYPESLEKFISSIK